MAKISVNPESDAPKGEEIHFVLGTVEFDLAGKDVYESDDLVVVSNAGAHPWLTVEVEAPELDPTKLEGYDANDPHDNPTADHLSALASPESIAAADSNERIIQVAHNGEPVEPSENPSVAESVQQTVEVAAPDSNEKAKLPVTPDASTSDKRDSRSKENN